MDVTDDPVKSSAISELQLLNAKAPIDVTDVPKPTDVRAVQPLKTLEPIAATDVPEKSSDCSELHPLNATSPIEATVVPKSTETS